MTNGLIKNLDKFLEDNAWEFFVVRRSQAGMGADRLTLLGVRNIARKKETHET